MISGPNYIPSFSLASFSQAVSAPFTTFKAYQAGTIDANGNLLKPESSIDDFEYFIIKLKKIFEELPSSYTKSRLGSYASTFQMFTEDAKSFGIDEKEFLMFLEGYCSGIEQLSEDMTTSSAGGGLGTPLAYENKGEIAGYEKPLGSPMFSRGSAYEMFDVNPDDFKNLKMHKAWKHMPDSETKRYLQRFQRRNRESKIAVRSTNPESGKQEVHWIKMKPISFMEEFGLDKINFLNDYTELSESRRQKYSAIVAANARDVEDLAGNIRGGTFSSQDFEKLNKLYGTLLSGEHILGKASDDAVSSFFKAAERIKEKKPESNQPDEFAMMSGTNQLTIGDTKTRTSPHARGRIKSVSPTVYSLLSKQGLSGEEFSVLKTDKDKSNFRRRVSELLRDPLMQQDARKGLAASVEQKGLPFILVGHKPSDKLMGHERLLIPAQSAVDLVTTSASPQSIEKLTWPKVRALYGLGSGKGNPEPQLAVGDMARRDNDFIRLQAIAGPAKNLQLPNLGEKQMRHIMKNITDPSTRRLLERIFTTRISND